MVYSHPIDIHSFLSFLAAEKALNATALKKAEIAPRTPHVSRPVRGTPARGSKFHYNRDFLLGKIPMIFMAGEVNITSFYSCWLISILILLNGWFSKLIHFLLFLNN